MAPSGSKQAPLAREDARREVVDVLAAALIARWIERPDPIAARATRIGAPRRARKPRTSTPVAEAR